MIVIMIVYVVALVIVVVFLLIVVIELLSKYCDIALYVNDILFNSEFPLFTFLEVLNYFGTLHKM